MPDRKIEWRDVIVGACVTSALFTVGKSLIGLYLGSSSVASGYGAAGALIVVLFWIYYSSEIFLLGAEFTRQYALARNPALAVPVTPPRRQDEAATMRNPDAGRNSGAGDSLALQILSLAIVAFTVHRRSRLH